MELLQPTNFPSIVASSKEQLKKISIIISKYCGQAKSERFIQAYETYDYTTANNILDETLKELTGKDNVFDALRLFADKFPQIPELSDKVSDALSETDKVKAIESYRSEILKIIDRKC